MHSIRASWLTGIVLGLAIAAGAASPTSAQQVTCGNAYYDDGRPDAFWYVSGGDAGDPDYCFGVRFELADFGYEPGKVAITGFCAGNAIDWSPMWFGAIPNEVFIYPDLRGYADDSVVLGHGTIYGGNGTGQSIVMLDEPVILQGDFWLVNRGYPPLAGTSFYMEGEREPDGGHSYQSSSGPRGLWPLAPAGDLCLRAYLEPVERSYLTGGIAHAAGAHGSVWRSKLSVLNTTDAPNRVTLRFLHGASAESATIELGPGELAAWDDVVVDLFGMAGGSSGAIRVEAEEPVLVTARTYNSSAAGTFGQYMPAVRDADAMSFGELGRLSQLSNTAGFRSNVGFLNLGRERAEVRVTLHGAAGMVLGSVDIAVPAGRWRQQNDVFGAAGVGEVANGYATVEVLTDGGMVWGCASVVDNSTGDPMTVPLAIQ